MFIKYLLTTIMDEIKDTPITNENSDYSLGFEQFISFISNEENNKKINTSNCELGSQRYLSFNKKVFFKSIFSSSQSGMPKINKQFIAKTKKDLHRSSTFRGVSKNGKKWQVIIMINGKKCYIGSFSNEKDAAKAYDIAAIQNRRNKHVLTNFFYSEEEINSILEQPNIYEIRKKDDLKLFKVINVNKRKFKGYVYFNILIILKYNKTNTIISCLN